jgi:hypothetical protein
MDEKNTQNVRVSKDVAAGIKALAQQAGMSQQAFLDEQLRLIVQFGGSLAKGPVYIPLGLTPLSAKQLKANNQTLWLFVTWHRSNNYLTAVGYVQCSHSNSLEVKLYPSNRHIAIPKESLISWRDMSGKSPTDIWLEVCQWQGWGASLHPWCMSSEERRNWQIDNVRVPGITSF